MRLPFSLLLIPALLSGCAGGETTNQSEQQEKQLPEVQQYTIEQFMNTVSVGGGAFSPDEKSLLVSTNETGIFNAYELVLETGEMTQLTNSADQTIRAISFFPNDKRFIYMADDGGDEIFHVYMQDEGGNATDLTPWEGARSSFGGWAHDKESFFVLSNQRNPQLMDLYEITLENMEAEMIYQNDQGFQWNAISDDKRYLVLNQPITSNSAEMWLFDRKTDKLTQLTDCQGKINYTPQEFGSDNASLYYTTDEGSEFQYLMKMDLESQETEKVAEYMWDIWYAYNSRNDKYRVIGVNEDGRTAMHIIDLASGKEVEFPDVDGEISGVRISKSEERMTFRVGTAKSPSDLYYHQIGSETAERLTHSLNPEIKEDDLVNGEVIRYESFDGLEIPSILYKPHTATADNQVPALVWVHGGPGGQSRVGYRPLIQYLVNHGYCILAVNNRGSSGYGKTFNKMDNRNHGEADLQDCIKAKDYFASLGYVDMDNIGIIGGSYGGYMTMAALTFQPDEFKCGVDIFGVTNWLRTIRNIPPWWESFKTALYDEMGDPTTDDSTRLYNISPLFHAHQIKQPFMVLQGANDPRVLQVESDEIVEAARKNGVEVEYVVFEDEGHGFVKKENEIEGYSKILQFLDKQLKASPAEAAEGGDHSGTNVGNG